MKNKIVYLLAAVSIAAAGAALASSGPDVRMMPAPAHRLDDESLQRGARNFVNYCLTCHSAKYMRYNRLTDIGLTEQQIKDNLIFGDTKIGDTMTVAMRESDAKAWFGTAPPDLSVETRIRGRDWIYNYLLGFYRDDKSVSGWNNLLFHNVAMPHVLWELSGTKKLVETTYDTHEKALAAAIAVKGLVAMEPAAGGKWLVKTVAAETEGKLTQVQYEMWVADLVNYMEFMAEPYKNRSINLGLIVLLYLGVLFVLAYALKRSIWKDLQ